MCWEPAFILRLLILQFARTAVSQLQFVRREQSCWKLLFCFFLYHLVMNKVAQIVIQAYPVPAVRFASFVLLMHYKLFTVYL